MRKVLNDDAINAQFVRDGFVRVPFITPEEVEELKQLFFDTLCPRAVGRSRPRRQVWKTVAS
jgi:hypothetical protein